MLLMRYTPKTRIPKSKSESRGDFHLEKQNSLYWTNPPMNSKL